MVSLFVNLLEDVEVFFLQISEVVLLRQLSLAVDKLLDEDALNFVNFLEEVFLATCPLGQKLRNRLHFDEPAHEVGIFSTNDAII